MQLIATVPFAPDHDGLNAKVLPAVVNGTLLLSPDYRLWGADPVTGKVHWYQPWPSHRLTLTTEMITDDRDGGTVYFRGHETPILKAVRVGDGTLRWTGTLPEAWTFYDVNSPAQDEHNVYVQATNYTPPRSNAIFVFDKGTGAIVNQVATPHLSAGMATVPGLLLYLDTWMDEEKRKQSVALVALDKATLTEQWRVLVADRGSSSYARLVVHEGRAYFGGNLGTGFVACVDVATGTLLWQTNGLTAADLTLGEDAGTLRLFVQDELGITALEASTGRELWSRPMGGYATAPVSYAGGLVYHSHYGPLYALDAVTGEVVAEALGEEGTGGGYGAAAWSDGERVYWLTTTDLYIYKAPQHSKR